MLGSTFIEAAIGLSLMYLLMSLMCSVTCEVIARVRESRSTYLFNAIDGLVRDKGLAALIEKHPLVQALGYKDKHRKWHRPSYLPSSLFARVVLDLLPPIKPAMAPVTSLYAPITGPGASNVCAYAPRAEVAPAKVTDGAPEKSNPLAQLREALKALIPEPLPTPEAEIALIAAWFDAAMERLSGTYKRSTQLTVFLLAVSLTLGLNVDTLVVANRLQRDKSLRDTVVASATSFANEHKDLGALDPAGQKLNDPATPIPTSDAKGRLLALEVQLEHLDLPIGWLSDADVEIADVEAKKADRALAEAWEDADMPASMWFKARNDVNTSGADLVAARMNGADKKTIDGLVEAYKMAKTAASTARSEDEAAKKAFAEALLVSEHLNRNVTEMQARTLTFAGPTFWGSIYIFLLRLIGWLLTAFAVSLGTRFWFDTLSKLMSIRSGVKPKEKKA